jgi:hypothetical protein
VSSSYRNEGRKHYWSTGDMAFLQEWYGVAPASDVADALGVSERAMREWARRMGIKAEVNRWMAGAPMLEEWKRREGYVLDFNTAPRSAAAIVRANRPDGGTAA